MKKQILMMVMISTISLSITACGKSDTPNNTVNQTETTMEESTDLTGTWISEESDGTYQEATITDNYIEINWVTPDSTSLYWAGTYVAPSGAVDEYSWISENDTEKTDSALLASSSETKEFTYKDGVITYEASALGTTKTVELKKQE